ncbi:uncharacterized protein LOC122565687 isoform X2 [Bombus pyrosoma]|uniref:uncharacterized protein LOC122565687 isoform X2 n=1 Tax=Bombus pyrosoma TaxID=396416 RepID=UPI001CB9D1B9|nr:uncharacterized protein LOC122565687 isoform X2 [Bombus pyrosoma]
MHFWINKPAGRYYGFTGRRYPATPLPKTRLNQSRYNADLRQMVTPLHRFQNLNAMGNTAGPIGSTQHLQLNNISNNVTTAGNNQLILSNTTSNGTNRSFLDFSEFNDAELASYRLRCGVSITFVLATGFVAAAKFYFSDRGQGIEILVFWGLLTLLLLFSCLYSILCCRHHHNSHEEHQIQEERIASVTGTTPIPNENIRPISVVRQNPPPPYHIAILIPSNNLPEEAPPPSYDKIMR